MIDDDAHFAEGPTVVDGTLYYVEYAAQTLMRWDGELGSLAARWMRTLRRDTVQAGFLITATIWRSRAGIVHRETLSVISRDADGNPCRPE